MVLKLLCSHFSWYFSVEPHIAKWCRLNFNSNVFNTINSLYFVLKIKNMVTLLNWHNNYKLNKEFWLLACDFKTVFDRKMSFSYYEWKLFVKKGVQLSLKSLFYFCLSTILVTAISTNSRLICGFRKMCIKCRWAATIPKTKISMKNHLHIPSINFVEQ